eukprot:49906-Rhodomonas_salina.1
MTCTLSLSQESESESESERPGARWAGTWEEGEATAPELSCCLSASGRGGASAPSSSGACARPAAEI